MGYYTHLNFAFALIDPVTFQVSSMGPEVAANYDALTSLKGSQPDLKVWLSIGTCSLAYFSYSPSRVLMHCLGGWSMNDPGSTATTFSDLAGSSAAQTKFFNSLITFMISHGFDGVDIDW